MTDQIAHILILVFPAAIVLGIVAAMGSGQGRLRQQGQTVLPAAANAVSVDDSFRLDMVNSVVDHTGNRS